MTQYPPHTWVDPRLVVKESAIHGKGVFTTRPIKNGEKLMVWGGQLVAKKDYCDGRWRDMTLVPVADDTFLGLPITDMSESIDEYLNHSCDPSAWLTDEVTVVARRDMIPGEEVTVDMATWDANEDPEWAYADEPCRCGTSLCRKVLTPRDWTRPELHTRYAGHFSPYIQKKIEEL